MLISNGTIQLVASVLGKRLTDREAAAVINALLTCQDDDRLTDREAVVGERLFDALTALRPEAVSIAAGA